MRLTHPSTATVAVVLCLSATHESALDDGKVVCACVRVFAWFNHVWRPWRKKKKKYISPLEQDSCQLVLHLELRKCPPYLLPSPDTFSLAWLSSVFDISHHGHTWASKHFWLQEFRTIRAIFYHPREMFEPRPLPPNKEKTKNNRLKWSWPIEGKGNLMHCTVHPSFIIYCWTGWKFGWD